ncbi:MAG: glycosyltransferase family 9 protein [Desulfovibrio sp.]|uniref:glycosyltransferase family 9 protein n=1 Tax=Desulfovibrio sp. TaxID=885 RepID=UPI00135D8C2E|nr:glycosyltransferase family 9 protein [Desulfovibrio sp.]MTJ91876.1 glycosyltransferase family 9 protein [Desulfovibrio sp.]
MGERGNSFNRLLDRFVGIPLAACSSVLRVGKGSKPVADPQRVGFICLGAIGDLLLLSALVAALREHLPHAHFVLLTSRANAATVSLIPGIDNCASFGVTEVAAMAAWLREQKLDVLIDSTQWARLGALLCNLSNARTTVGFDTDGQHRAFGYSFAVKHRNDRHEVENFLELGRVLYPGLLGVPGILLPQSPPDDLPAELCARLEPTGDVGDALPRRVFLHMWPSGANAWLKEWPADHWDALARTLSEKGCEVYLTGAPADAPRNDAFLRAYPQCPAISLAGRISLPGLAWLFNRATAVVSVNTGTMHLAAIAGAPTVGLHGPTNPLRWGPVGRHVRSLLPHKGPYAYLNLGFEYPLPHKLCLDSLPVEDVEDALRSLAAL